MLEAKRVLKQAGIEVLPVMREEFALAERFEAEDRRRNPIADESSAFIQKDSALTLTPPSQWARSESLSPAAAMGTAERHKLQKVRSHEVRAILQRPERQQQR